VNDSDLLVDIRHLSKTYPKSPPALQEIHATIPRGKIVGLAGPDGAGKTTLLRLIAGLLCPTQGSITVAGYDSVTHPEEIHCITGYMPQKFGLYEDLTVIQNLHLYADLRGVVGAERTSALRNLLHFTTLGPFVDRLSGALSGGMKQKLGLACALISKPTLLLLDEPSVGVDPISRRELWKMVSALLQQGISVIWSTAYLDEAERCDSVLLLNEGKLLYQGPPNALTQRVSGRVYEISHIPGNNRPFLSTLLHQENVMDGVIQGDKIRIVVKEKRDPPIDLDSILRKGEGEASTDESLRLAPIAPRFEDAFIDILGGGPGGESALADHTPSIKGKSDIVVVAQHLTKRFGTFTAASDISFAIRRGEIFGLLGPNGAGKSTTFKMMCGLLRPTSGMASVNNLDLQKAPGEARKQIGYMAQKFSLYGILTVRQNLEFFSGIYNLSGEKQRTAVSNMIEIFNFSSYVDTAAQTLPLGFKQRLALACATIHHPDILFLDEPTSGVDPITRREFWNHINGLVEKGVTIMVTTHFMDEAEYCDRIALVYSSKIIHIGTPQELKTLAKSPTQPDPTLEDAFIKLIEQYDSTHTVR
jgi:ABC-2 type transport system ATP-binding protein